MFQGQAKLHLNSVWQVKSFKQPMRNQFAKLDVRNVCLLSRKCDTTILLSDARKSLNQHQTCFRWTFLRTRSFCLLRTLTVTKCAVLFVCMHENCTVGPWLSGHQLSRYSSIIRPQSCSVYCLFFIHFHIKSCLKNTEDEFLLYFMLFPFHMNDDLLQIE